MHVIAWLIAAGQRDYLLVSGVMEVWYAVIFAVLSAATYVFMVADHKRGGRLRARTVRL
jgi:hypothetical protein